MTFSVTPEPGNLPPRVRLELDTDDPGAVFSSLEIRRDTKLIREQPILGATESFAFDYEAPFGVPIRYTASGTIVEPVDPDWTESWPDLSAWTSVTPGWSATAGQAKSSTIDARIKRSATGIIQSVSVADPAAARFELLDAGDNVISSISFEDRVTLVSGGRTVQASGPSSFTLLMSGGTITATGASWSLTAEYSGSPTQLQIVSRGRAYLFVAAIPFVTGSPRGIAIDGAGNYLVIDYSAKKLRKFTPGGTEILTGGFPINTVGEGRGVAIDGSGNIYVTDVTNTLVRKFSSAGVAGITWGTSDYPYGIAFNPVTGNLHISRDDTATHSGSMRRYTTAGATVGSSTSTGGIPRDVHVDAAGKSYITDSTSDQIKRYNATPTLDLTINVGTDIRGITTDAAGNIFVTCPEEYSVRVYNSAGTYVTQFSTVGRNYGIAIDAAGNPVATEYAIGTIRRYATTDGTVGQVSVTPAGPETGFEESFTTSLDVVEAWLIHPSKPSLSLNIDPGPGSTDTTGIHAEADSGEVRTSEDDSFVHWIVGRPRPVVVTNGSRHADTWTLFLHAPTIELKNAIRSLVDDQTPLLLRSPEAHGWDLPDDWYSVGRVQIKRDDVPEISTASMAELPLTPVDEPIVRRGASRSYGDLVIEYATYESLLEQNPTYLSLLAG